MPQNTKAEFGRKLPPKNNGFTDYRVGLKVVDNNAFRHATFWYKDMLIRDSLLFIFLFYSRQYTEAKFGRLMINIVKDKDHLNSNSADKADHGKENTDTNHLPIK